MEMAESSNAARHVSIPEENHVQQRSNWDCGLACTFMVLRHCGHSCDWKELEDFTGTKSVWTIDLAMLLASKKIRFTYFTALAGIDQSHQNFVYYQDQFQEDEARVSRLFQLASDAGVHIVEKNLSLDQLVDLARTEHIAIITLVDSSCLAPPQDERRCPLKSRSYVGHYILIVGYDDGSGAFIYRDPADSQGRRRAAAAALAAARARPGTDGDALVVDLSPAAPPCPGPAAAAAVASRAAAAGGWGEVLADGACSCLGLGTSSCRRRKRARSWKKGPADGAEGRWTTKAAGALALPRAWWEGLLCGGTMENTCEVGGGTKGDKNNGQARSWGLNQKDEKVPAKISHSSKKNRWWWQTKDIFGGINQENAVKILHWQDLSSNKMEVCMNPNGFESNNGGACLSKNNHRTAAGDTKNKENSAADSKTHYLSPPVQTIDADYGFHTDTTFGLFQDTEDADDSDQDEDGTSVFGRNPFASLKSMVWATGSNLYQALFDDSQAA